MALVECGGHKKEELEPRRELALLEERGKRRKCELGEREREWRPQGEKGPMNYK